MKGKRKTLNASDVLSAMEEMEFQRFVAPLKEALEGIHPHFCFLSHRKDGLLRSLITWFQEPSTRHDSTLFSW